jgi:site-specific DNA recombinase
MKHYFGYVRVSTAKQGEQGVSLQEQRAAIEQYAMRHQLTIARWYEEQLTAAKRGRRVFEKMLRDRKRDRIAGVIVHKIDRSARNFFDWAGLSELMDEGVEVHVASENRRIETRGDRLAADVQAVVAVDYIRNLREETIKGFYGRLKQGLYPLSAPTGYLDRGGGKVKEIDPTKGPLVRSAFEHYATGAFTLDTLAVKLAEEGLRTRAGNLLSANALWKILRNPFYMGLIRIEKRGEHFLGVHKSLVSKQLFDEVQTILSGRGNRTTVLRHPFLFRRLFLCGTCGRTLSGEVQKGIVYYRCHTRSCPGVCVREEEMDRAVREALASLTFGDEHEGALQLAISHCTASAFETARGERERTRLALAQVESRLTRLTDAYIDGTLEKELFEGRQASLLSEKRNLQEQHAALAEPKPERAIERVRRLLELAKSALLSYNLGTLDEKRALVSELISNRTVSMKDVVVELSDCFKRVATWLSVAYSGLEREDFRTAEELVAKLLRTAMTEGWDNDS